MKLSTAILEMREISKYFGGNAALENVNLSVRPKTIHAIVGENGAGKSTLMKILSGVYSYKEYEGDIVFLSEKQKFKSILDSEAKGIIIIHQELALVPKLSIAENLFLGHELQGVFGVDWHRMHERAVQLLAQVGLHLNPQTLIEDLGVGQQQLVEIAKALSKKVKLLILDEPTASLNEVDSQALLELMLQLKAQGVACILISHKLNEVAAVADEITVLRDGASVETLTPENGVLDEGRIIKGMIGRDLENRYPARANTIGEDVLEVLNWCVVDSHGSDRAILKNINLNVRAGEVVGIAGLMGSGRTELALKDLCTTC